MNTFATTFARMSRWLLGGAAAGLLAIAAMPAQAQTNGTAKQSNGTAICTFNGFSFDSATNTLTVNCTTTPPPPPPPPTCSATASGSFSFWLPASGAYLSNTNAPLQVTRSNAMDGACDLTYTVTAPAGAIVTVNGSSAATGTIRFEDQDYAIKMLNVVVKTSVDAAVDITLTTTASGGVTPFATHTVYVTGVPDQQVPGCNTSANYLDTFTIANQKIVFALKPGETGAIAITPTASSGVITLSTTDTINTPSDADHEVTISTCPGDFSTTVPAVCRYSANFVGSSRWMNTGAQSPVLAYHCPVTAGTKYYMNVRQVKLGTTINSCNGPAYLNGACEVRLQNTGL